MSEPLNESPADWEGRFKTPDAMWEAYQNSQSEMNRAQAAERQAREEAEQWQEYVSGLEEQTRALQAQQYQQPQQSQQIDDSPFYNLYEQARDNGDLRNELTYNAQLMTGIAERVAQAKFAEYMQQLQTVMPQPNQNVDNLVAESVERTMIDRFGDDWGNMKNQLADYVQANPHVLNGADTPMEAANRLTDALFTLKGRNLQSETGLQEELASRQAKLAAQGVTGSGQQPGSPSDNAQYLQRIFDAQLSNFKPFE